MFSITYGYIRKNTSLSSKINVINVKYLLFYIKIEFFMLNQI